MVVRLCTPNLALAYFDICISTLRDQTTDRVFADWLLHGMLRLVKTADF